MSRPPYDGILSGHFEKEKITATWIPDPRKPGKYAARISIPQSEFTDLRSAQEYANRFNLHGAPHLTVAEYYGGSRAAWMFFVGEDRLKAIISGKPGSIQHNAANDWLGQLVIEKKEIQDALAGREASHAAREEPGRPPAGRPSR